MNNQLSNNTEQQSVNRSKLAIALDGFDKLLITISVSALIISLGATVFQVIARYIFDSPVSWSEELSRFTFIWLTFISAALAVREGSMVRVDTFVNAAPKWMQSSMQSFTSMLVALIAVFLLIFGTQVCLGMGSVSLALEWPVWWFYAAAPIGGLFILINLMRTEPDKKALVKNVIIIATAFAFCWVFFIAKLIPVPDINIGVVVIAAVVFLICIGVPISYSIASGAVIGYWLTDRIPMTALPHQWVNGVDSFLLLAIPFFLLAGQLMNEGGITRRLIALASVFVGHITGGLAHVNILSSFLMGGLTGSSAGDAAALTKTLVPEMTKRGYDKAFSCAVTSASSILSNLIPPSILLMIYGAVAEASIGRLFLAGILPAVILTSTLMGICHFISIKRGYKGSEKRSNTKEIIKEARSALWAFPMPIIILGGIRFGITTPTEAAGVAVVYALIVGLFVFRELKFSRIPKLLLKACLETSMIMMILGASRPFSWVLTAEQIPQATASFLTGLSSSPVLILLIVLVFLLVVGLVLEPAPGIIILVPILLPVVTNVGMDPVQFGVVFVLVGLMGSLTPPVGLLVYISSGIAEVPAAHVFKEILPMLFASFIALLVITYFPPLSMWLPSVLF